MILRSVQDIDNEILSLYLRFLFTVPGVASFQCELWCCTSCDLVPQYIASHKTPTQDLDMKARILVNDSLHLIGYEAECEEWYYIGLYERSLGGVSEADLLSRKLMRLVMVRAMLDLIMQ
jgi:hypothetical protein